MKVKFKAVRFGGEQIITSNGIIQKYVNGKLWILLNVNTHWVRVKPETLKVNINQNS